METKNKVRFYGSDIGFQFSQTSDGSRSRMAKITNIHEATDEEKIEIRKMVVVVLDFTSE